LSALTISPPSRAIVDLDRARRAMDHELKLYEYDDVRVQFEVVPHLIADPQTVKFRRMVGRWRADAGHGCGAPPGPHATRTGPRVAGGAQGGYRGSGPM
jgi:hypothetical protein